MVQLSQAPMSLDARGNAYPQSCSLVLAKLSFTHSENLIKGCVSKGSQVTKSKRHVVRKD